MVIRKRSEDRKVTTKIFLKNLSGNIHFEKKFEWNFLLKM